MRLYDILFLLSLSVLIVYDLSYKRKSEYSIDSSNILKGIMSIVILFHHISQNSYEGIFSKVGVLAVGVFFFISGYTLYYGCYEKGNKNDKVWLKIKKILLYSLITLIISIVSFYILSEPIQIDEILNCYRGNRVMNWYFTSQIIMYILFMISVKFAGGAYKALFFNTLFIILYMGTVYFFNYGSHWYISTPCFLLGGIFYILKKYINPYFNKYIMTIMIALFCITFLIGNINLGDSVLSKLTSNGLRILSCLFFASIMWKLSCHVKSRKELLSLTGKHSAQIIMLQTIAMTIGNKIAISDDFYIILVCISLIALVIIFEPLYRNI